MFNKGLINTGFLFISNKMILFIAICCVIAALWIYARWNYGSLEKMGIPVVPYSNPILGHTSDLYEKPGPYLDIDWMKKYGKIFGIYEGRQHQVFICIPELVRLICVKEAEYFNDSRRIDFGDPIANEFPGFQPYEKWRILRPIVTPAFTAAKLKLMNLPMREASEDYVTILKKQIKLGNGKLSRLPIDTSVHAMLTDLILRCIYSIKIGDGEGENYEFAKFIKEMFAPTGNSLVPKSVLHYASAFPFLRKIFPSTMFQPGASDKFIRIFQQMQEQRKYSDKQDNFDMIVESFSKLGSEEFNKAGITETSLTAIALVFFVASQDPISTMVSAVIYHMTLDPEMERKLYAEVDSVFAKNGGSLEHSALKDLKLLDSCIQEALRLYPVNYRLGRTCTKDWRNEEYNLEIKKGTVVMLPLWAINRNPEYVENPDEFQPERFLQENKGKLDIYATTSFGHGPRNCLGQKFATDVMPTLLAYLLKEFKFVKRNDTKIEFVPGTPFFAPHKPVYVDVMLR